MLALLQRAAEALTAAELQIGELHAEVDRLNAYVRDQWDSTSPERAVAGSGSTTGGGGQTGGSAGVAQALEVMARAEQVAFERLAHAEDEERQAHYRATAAEQRVHAAQQRVAAAAQQARELTARADREATAAREKAGAQAGQLLQDAERGACAALEAAREQYEQILTRAHRRAEHAAQTAMQEFLDCPAEQAGMREQLQARATYLRGMTQVSGTTLRAALESTRREFDQLVGARDREPGLPTLVISSTGDVTGVQSRPAAFSAR